ncbi:MAG: peptide-methionine (S)-S-oxide reductase MsrA [Caldimonas sp.]
MSSTPTPSLSAPRRLAVAALVGLGAAVVVASALHLSPVVAAEAAVKIPAAALDETAGASGMQTAVFAGGCFWGVQGVFQHVQGVSQAVSGYTGGKKETAQYEMIGSGLTGHAEAVKITYDPKKVSYATLLQIYFSVVHDPTQLDRQHPDVGPQYRSAVFTTSAAQKATTERYIAQLDAARSFHGKIVTQVTPLTEFYAAEAYHQDYLTLHPTQPYIAQFDLPKLANLKSMFSPLYRADPVLVTASRQP